MSCLINKRVRVATCPTCKRPVLVAVDEGLTVRAEPTPLPDRAAEIIALTQGRRTYSLMLGGWLVLRDQDRMNLGGSVHTEHHCARRSQ